MAVIYAPETRLFQMIAALVGVNLNASNATLSNARFYEGTTSHRNSSVDVTHNGSTFTVNYDRLDLGVLGSQRRPRGIHFAPGETTHGMLNVIEIYLGFTLTVDDIEDLPVSVGEDGMYTLKVVAKEGALLWHGGFDILFKDLPVIEGTLFQPTNMGYI